MIEVFSTAEFRRVRDLPRRPQTWPKAKLDEAVSVLTDHFRLPDGTEVLRPIQARALCEAGDHGGLVGRLAPGAGKTLLSALLFSLWGAQRGLLFVPAKLRDQAFIEWARLSRHWRLPNCWGVPAQGNAPGMVRILSYESLSSIKQAAFLEEYRPDVVVADEAHAFSRMGAARSRRFFRYLKAERRAHGFEAVRFVPLSGSFTRQSMKEDAHLYVAALGKGAPVPDHYPDLEQWCGALDDVQEQARFGPGALLELCSAEERAEVAAAESFEDRQDIVRRAYQRRVLDTPGVIGTVEVFNEVPLSLVVRDVAIPPAVRTAMSALRLDGLLPTGDVADSALTLWAHAREMASGFTYRWDPPAPAAWLAARKAWHTFVREVLSGNHPGLDSPLQVWNAVANGRLGSVPEWSAWTAIRDSFVPNPVPFWLDRFAFRDAENWAVEHNGIVWVQHSSAAVDGGDAVVSEEAEDAALVSCFTRIPYFGAGKAGEPLRDYRGPCAASIRAHGTGKNLVQWSEALLMTVPSSGATLEQVLARLHRPGQKKPVRFHVYIRSREDDEALIKCFRNARYVEAVTGQPQRILAATVTGWSESAGDERDRTDPMWMSNGEAV